MSTIDDDGSAPAPSSESRVAAGSHDQLPGRARFDAFISYRRLPADTAFVDQLQKTLAERGMNVWVDRTDIEPAADWSERILRGIEAAKAFIFVITPESAVSGQCLRELEAAAAHHKLIIPLALRDTDRRDLPGSLLTPNWIFFFGPGHDLQRGLDDVVTALEEDLGWRDTHTRLGVRAKEWSDSRQDRGFLLRGSDLRSAEEWLGHATMHDKTPPTALQTEYILASRKATTRTQRTWRTALSVGLIVSLSLAALAFVQRQQAIQQRDIAVSGELASRSEALGDTNPVLAKLLSIAAWRIDPSSDARYAMLTAATLPGTGILNAQDGAVTAVAFSPNGATLASSDTYGIQLWDAATGRPIGSPLHGQGDILSMAFSPDGKTLASGSYFDHRVWLWNAATGRPVGSPLAGHANSVDSMAFSPDGKTLASGSADHTVRLWNVATGRPVGGPLTDHSDAVESVAFSPDGKILASGSDDGRIRLWDVAARRSKVRVLDLGQAPAGDVLPGHACCVLSVAFSPDGKILASGDIYGTIRLWDAATGRPVGSPMTGAYSVESVAFSPDGKTLASGSDDGMVRLWDVATGRPIGSPLAGHTDKVKSVAFSPDGKTLASGSYDGTTRLWDVALGSPIGGPLTSNDGPGDAVAFSPDGKTLASGSDAGTILLWDVATRRPLGSSPLAGHYSPVTAVAFSPDGKTLASGGDATMVSVVATGRQIDSLVTSMTEHLNTTNSVAFSPDGKILASGIGDGTIMLWHAATGQPIGNPLPGTYSVESVAFSPDGKTLASGSDDGMIRLWDVATGREIGGPLTGHAGGVDSVAFSPDGKTLASGGNDHTIRLWDVATGREIGGPLTGHAGAVNSVAFSPDGNTLASGSDDRTIRLWNVATEQPIGSPLTGHANSVASVAFSPDGKTLASGGSDGVRLWDVAYTVDTAAYLCGSARRSLTRAEWTHWVPAGPAYQDTCP